MLTVEAALVEHRFCLRMKKFHEEKRDWHCCAVEEWAQRADFAHQVWLTLQIQKQCEEEKV